MYKKMCYIQMYKFHEEIETESFSKVYISYDAISEHRGTNQFPLQLLVSPAMSFS